MKLNLTGRIILTVLCFGVALVGFMIKLPSVFRQHDTELHTLFYFLAAGFLNVLFVKRNLAGHVLVFAVLYAMGAAIEHAQEYSNSVVGERIHGRYDPEDVRANLEGLVIFSVLWGAYVILWHATRASRKPQASTEMKSPPALPVHVTNAGRSQQIDASLPRFASAQDEFKLGEAIRLITEVINRNPNHPLLSQLEAMVSELKKKIQTK